MKHRVKSVTCRTAKSVRAIKSVDDEKGEETWRLPGLNVERAKDRIIRQGYARSAVRNGYRYAANRSLFTQSERNYKTVVSCRSDMETYQGECEADDRCRKKQSPVKICTIGDGQDHYQPSSFTGDKEM